MRIDNIEVQNYKKFAHQTLNLDPHFNLLVGENGSGKTSVLDALAIALGIWLVDPPEWNLIDSGRPIRLHEIRLESVLSGDRTLFQEYRPTIIRATGMICDRTNITWQRQISETGKRTTNADSKEALAIIKDVYQRDKAGEAVLCPVIGYYGAGRAWLSANRRVPDTKNNGPARRWAAFDDCLNERIGLQELKKWFKNELIAAGHEGRKRPGFQIVRQAIVDCVPGADDVWFDADLDQIAMSINGQSQPFGNLSAGQQMMLALVADIAIKCVTQNSFLVPKNGSDSNHAVRPVLLEKTPGVVLIDEIDVHLHPRWQRQVEADLKRTFPSIQFVCTSHSPQVIGEAQPHEIRLLDTFETPSQSFGMDSNWILKVLMGADEQDLGVKEQLAGIMDLIQKKKLDEADLSIQELRSRVGNSQSIQFAASTIDRMRLIGR